MALQILETTVPASADMGLRTFEVTHLEPTSGRPLRSVQIAVCAQEDRSQDGEEPQMVDIHGQVPSNHELAHALILTGAELLKQPGQHLANPDD